MGDQPDRKRNKLKAYHKWVSLALSIFILLFALSGIVLNHRGTFSGLSVDRGLLPEAYRYRNWNLASVKGSLRWSPDSILVFGNIGIWKSDNHLRSFSDFNAGLARDADHRKITSLSRDSKGNLYAAGLFGLYRYQISDRRWVEEPFPDSAGRIVKLLSRGDSLLVLTRDHLWMRSTPQGAFRIIPLPPAADEDGKTGLFRAIWVFHSGEILSTAGKLLVDGIAVVFIFLTLTGLVYVLFPSFIRRAGPRLKNRFRDTLRWSIRWHNLVGIWSVLFLLFTAATGMFLRPPFLILIAETRVSAIFSGRPTNNPWEDQLRDLLFDSYAHRFLLATSEGIYACDPDFREAPEALPAQPPVSVMGITVFEQTGRESLLVGSFSGLYEWFPTAGRVVDHLTGREPVPETRKGPPVGDFSVAGYIPLPQGACVFDYGRGLICLDQAEMAPMSPQIIEASPLSLWGLALEVHTGRIWEDILGPFYILVVPITGLGCLFILISGGILWFRKRSKRLHQGKPDLTPTKPATPSPSHEVLADS